MSEKKLFDWQQAFDETYRSAVQLFAENFPSVIGAILILVSGFLIAMLLRLLTRKLTLVAERMVLRSARWRGLAETQERTYSNLTGNIVFWSVLLFFIATSANLLGWKIFSGALQSFLAYLPSLLTGLLIIFAGLVFGRMTRTLVESAASVARTGRPEMPGRIAQFLIVITAFMIGIEQLGINIGFLTTAMIVITGVLLAGGALAFSLGARHYVANLIGARISHQHFEPGQWIRLGQLEGRLLEITQTALVLDTAQGRAVIPASLLQQDPSEIITDPGESSGSLLDNLFRKKGEDSNGPV